MSRKRKIIWVMVIFLVTDWFLLDRFLIYGVITDKVTGQPIPNAAVILTLRGSRPFFPWPHNPQITGACIRSYVRKTDSHGRYGLLALALNSIMFDKDVKVRTFKPEYYRIRNDYGEFVGGSVNAGLLGLPSRINVELTPDMDERLRLVFEDSKDNLPTVIPSTLSPGDPQYQQTWSPALEGAFDDIDIGSSCSHEAWDTYLNVLDYGIRRAVTDKEKDFVKGKCRDLSKIAGVTLPEAELHRLKILGKPRPKPIYDFPYQCDSLFQDAGKRADTQR